MIDFLLYFVAEQKTLGLGKIANNRKCCPNFTSKRKYLNGKRFYIHVIHAIFHILNVTKQAGENAMWSIVRHSLEQSPFSTAMLGSVGETILSKLMYPYKQYT